jgi:hypothetical protein
MLQWITSVVNDTRRAAVAIGDLVATMNAERALMRGWLTRP